jgi:hypothetical protein
LRMQADSRANRILNRRFIQHGKCAGQT